jgi:hypothetical protein
VPDWFAEAFESEGYDSEDLAVLAGLIPPRSEISTLPSSRGFSVVADTSNDSARNVWMPVEWPADVLRLTAQYNPSHWKFPRVTVGERGGVGCGCADRCNAISCKNAKASRFCTASNCSFAGYCSNSLQESSALALRLNARTGMRGVVATKAIFAGVVLSQYLGHVQLLGPPCRNAPANEGFRMHLKTRTTGNKYVGIDALYEGGMLRMLNHSCNPTARIHEVQTGGTLTVVGVSVRDIFPGDKVAVSYGGSLWFVCRCGWWGCQHRDLQHLPDKTADL